jgi:hypothetical protein
MQHPCGALEMEVGTRCGETEEELVDQRGFSVEEVSI